MKRMVKTIKPYLTTLPALLSLVYSIRLAIAAPTSTPLELAAPHYWCGLLSVHVKYKSNNKKMTKM